LVAGLGCCRGIRLWHVVVSRVVGGPVDCGPWLVAEAAGHVVVM
jgi:hypothetical protein